MNHLRSGNNQTNSAHIFQPDIFRSENPTHMRIVNRLCNDSRIMVIDDAGNQSDELRIVVHPALLMKTERSAPRQKRERTVWAYYPWRATLVRCLEKNAYRRLRLSRNKDLITSAEQKKLSGANIAIAGLNVGNPAALCLALEGVGAHMNFADNDTLTVSNLNRFRAGLCDVGLNKAVLSARQVAEVDPFINVKIYPNGITDKNITEFLTRPRADVLVEEMDNLPLKISIREQARKQGIPTVMVTGNGPNVILDVERFDMNRSTPLLNNYLRSRVIRDIQSGGKMTLDKKIALARDFMGAQHLTKRLRDSFGKIGLSLAGIPQIAESSFLRGAVLCYAIRKILLGERAPSGRYICELDSVFTK